MTGQRPSHTILQNLPAWDKISQVVFEQSNSAIVVTNEEAEVIAMNGSFTDLTGYTYQEVIGKDLRFLKSGEHDPGFYDQIWESIKIIGQWQGKIIIRCKDGRNVPHNLTIMAIKDANGEIVNFVGMFFDMTSAQDNEEFLQHVATHDPLTNLPNRSHFYDVLNQAIYDARLGRTSLAVLFIDLDGFKAVNDTFGHEVGDQLLQAVGERLQTVMRPQNILARLGGDEFTILLENITDQSAVSSLAEEALQAIRQLYPLDDVVIQISASIGISLFPQDGENADKLLQHADQAMYKVKDRGKNSFGFHQE